MADKNTTADKSNAQAEQNQPHVQHAENAAAQPTATSEAPHAATPADFFGKAAFFNADGVAAAQKFFDVQALTAAAKTWVPDAVVAATQKIMDDQRKSVEQFAAAQRQLAEQFAAEQGKMLEQWWAPAKAALAGMADLPGMAGAPPVGKFAEDHTARTQAAHGEWQRMQGEVLQQVVNGIDEVAKLSKASVAYYANLMQTGRSAPASPMSAAVQTPAAV